MSGNEQTSPSPRRQLSERLVRYLQPALTMLGAVVLFGATALIQDRVVAIIPFLAMPVFYLAGAIWWARRAAELDARLWPDGLLALLPMIPTAVMAKLMADHDDEAIFWGPLLLIVMGAICLIPPLWLAIRTWGEHLDRHGA